MNNSIVIENGKIVDLEKIFPFYSKDFIEEEKKTFGHLKNLMENFDYNLIIGKSNEKIIGYAFMYEMVDTKFLWLDYIAILEGNRGLNFGSQFLNKLIQYYENDYNGIFFEIEKPDKNSSQYLFQLKRLNFYDQFNLEKQNIEYKIPTKDGGFPIDLYYKPLNNSPLTSQNIKRAIESVFDTIHFDISIRKDIMDSIFLSI